MIKSCLKSVVLVLSSMIKEKTNWHTKWRVLNLFRVLFDSKKQFEINAQKIWKWWKYDNKTKEIWWNKLKCGHEKIDRKE